ARRAAGDAARQHGFPLCQGRHADQRFQVHAFLPAGANRRLERGQELMLAITDPREAYRRSEIDARVEGGVDPADLVRLCYEQAIGGLGLAVIAHGRQDREARSKALTRALSAVTALDMGVDRSAPLADALLRLYGSARKAILDSVLAFDAEVLGRVRQDFIEIAAALGRH